MFLDFNWSVFEDQHNSYHFPIIIEKNTFTTEEHNLKWTLNRANYVFNKLCTGKLIPKNFKEFFDLLSYLILSLLPLHLLKSLNNVFLKPRQIQLNVIHGTMTIAKKLLNNATSSISIQKISKYQQFQCHQSIMSQSP